jgi:hypothetical protein
VTWGFGRGLRSRDGPPPKASAVDGDASSHRTRFLGHATELVLTWETSAHKRVKAVILYLAESPESLQERDGPGDSGPVASL